MQDTLKQHKMRHRNSQTQCISETHPSGLPMLTLLAPLLPLPPSGSLRLLQRLLHRLARLPLTRTILRLDADGRALAPVRRRLGDLALGVGPVVRVAGCDFVSVELP